jgi:hypothetical protein
LTAHFPPKIDPDARLDASQRAIALLVQHTLEEHYAFVLAYTHLVRDEGLQHTRARFDSVPAIVRPLVAGMVRDCICSRQVMALNDRFGMSALTVAIRGIADSICSS